MQFATSHRSSALIIGNNGVQTNENRLASRHTQFQPTLAVVKFVGQLNAMIKYNTYTFS